MNRLIHLRPAGWGIRFFAAALWIAFMPAVVAAGELAGTPIDESYRGEFTKCDATNTFSGVRLPIVRNGKTVWFDCSDKSHLARLERIAASGSSPQAIIFESKLGWDEDGSKKACENPGRTDQCGTSLMLKGTEAHPCPKSLAKVAPYCLPIDADSIPYVVIPGLAPKGVDGKAFRKKTGLAVGDVGIVVANGKEVPVVIADIGPAYKIGEGSTALLARLSPDGKPRTLPKGAVFVLFPRSALARNASADTFASEVEAKAQALYRALQAR